MVKNPKLSQAISDAGWGELTRQLAYKALWYGRNFVQLDRWFPGSKTCSKCGHVVEKLPLSVREWACPECNAHHDRDENAAINHLAAGLAVLVCGATGATRREQISEGWCHEAETVRTSACSSASLTLSLSKGSLTARFLSLPKGSRTLSSRPKPKS